MYYESSANRYGGYDDDSMILSAIISQGGRLAIADTIVTPEPPQTTRHILQRFIEDGDLMRIEFYDLPETH